MTAGRGDTARGDEIIVTRSARETQQLGASLAARLRPGDCVGLDGDLGAGKTCLIQGVCEGFGVEGPVTSPTFVLINEYVGTGSDGRDLTIFHFDLYRLGGVDELIDLGCDDYFFGDGVCLIEWASYAGEVLPEATLRIQICAIDETSRRFEMSEGRV